MQLLPLAREIQPAMLQRSFLPVPALIRLQLFLGTPVGWPTVLHLNKWRARHCGEQKGRREKC